MIRHCHSHGAIRGGELIERLAAVADQHGVAAPDVKDLHLWRRHRLLAKPIQVGRGRGKGSAAYYRQEDLDMASAVLRLRAQGLRRWRDIRLTLWIHGHDCPEMDVRRDLASIAQEVVAHINRDLRSEYWAPPIQGAVPRRPRYRRLAADLVSTGHPESFRHRLDGASPGALGAWQSILATSDFRSALEAMGHLMIEGNTGALIRTIAGLAHTTQRSIMPAPEVLTMDFEALSGLLSADDQVLIAALNASTPERIEAARFLIREAGATVSGLLAAVIEALRQSENWPDLSRADCEWLADFMEGFAYFARPRSDADRLVVLMIMLVLDHRHPRVDLLHIQRLVTQDASVGGAFAAAGLGDIQPEGSDLNQSGELAAGRLERVESRLAAVEAVLL
jgi:hypothetical protein